MDALDKKILTVINRSIPLEERPFKAVADRVGISEGEVIRRIAGLKAAGIIRRIGGVINPRGLGWHSTLCAASVPEDRIEDYAEVVN
ncbi:MAG TPA: Lrp/AsnC family transcriptional regulator, partial [Deltaproteobacteria bacterium]|nr:Lrp/AsnC family transcriptional regulator [Deltaproteobacteria bacterium]